MSVLIQSSTAQNRAFLYRIDRNQEYDSFTFLYFYVCIEFRRIDNFTNIQKFPFYILENTRSLVFLIET